MPSTFDFQCRYFAQGACRRGAQCLYKHDRSAPFENVCRHFLQGHCAYGNKCRYDHIRNNRPMAAAHDPANQPSSSSRPPSKPSSARPKVVWAKPTAPAPSTSALSASAAPFVPRVDQSSSKATYEFEAACGIPDTTTRLPPTMKPGELIDCLIDIITAVQPLTENNRASYSCATSSNLPPSYVEPILCPHYILGQCQYGDTCQFAHGEMCDICQIYALHPTDQRQRDKHKKECSEQAEAEMTAAFTRKKAADMKEASKDKQCGICMDTVFEKETPSERRFGLMSGCAHIYCLMCIKEWRQAAQFENKVRRACPQCRVKSDYIIPSNVFVDAGEEKNEIVAKYRASTATKPCRFFQKGAAECRFGNQCFFRHATPDGTVVEGEDPAVLSARRAQQHDDRAQQYWWRDLIVDDLEGGFDGVRLDNFRDLMGEEAFRDMMDDLDVDDEIEEYGMYADYDGDDDIYDSDFDYAAMYHDGMGYSDDEPDEGERQADNVMCFAEDLPFCDEDVREEIEEQTQICQDIAAELMAHEAQYGDGTGWDEEPVNVVPVEEILGGELSASSEFTNMNNPFTLSAATLARLNRSDRQRSVFEPNFASNYADRIDFGDDSDLSTDGEYDWSAIEANIRSQSSEIERAMAFIRADTENPNLANGATREERVAHYNATRPGFGADGERQSTAVTEPSTSSGKGGRRIIDEGDRRRRGRMKRARRRNRVILKTVVFYMWI